MIESFNKIVLTLLEATLTLYPANTDGTPDTSLALWTGVRAERVEIHERWESVQTRASGAKFPKRHNIVQSYEVTVGRVWVLPGQTLNGFVPGRNDRYVLDLTWRDEDAYPEGAQQWHRRTFYGVTLGERSIASREIDNGHTETQVFAAESMAVASGTGTPPAVSGNAAAPFVVKYMADGQSVDLYSYDPTTQLFTALTDPSQMALLTYAAGAFTVTFAGDDSPAMTLTSGGTLQVTAAQTGAPDNGHVPRLDFYYGTQRLWSVTGSGTMFSNGTIEGIAADGSGQYNLLASSQLKVSHSKLGTTVGTLHVFTPGEISGLKLWVEVESLKGLVDDAPVRIWPDQSGNGNDLTGGTGGIYRRLIRSKAAVEFSEQWPGPVAGLAYSLFLRTATPIFIPDTCVVFAVGSLQRLNGVNGGDFVGAVGGGESDPGDIMIGAEQGKLTGLYVTDLGNQIATGNIIPMDRFGLFEVEVTATQVISRKNGLQEAVTTISGSKPGEQRTVVVGSRNGATGFLNGYVRAVLVYEGTLTAKNKARVRQYLNQRYRIY